METITEPDDAHKVTKTNRLDADWPEDAPAWAVEFEEHADELLNETYEIWTGPRYGDEKMSARAHLFDGVDPDQPSVLQIEIPEIRAGLLPIDDAENLAKAILAAVSATRRAASPLSLSDAIRMASALDVSLEAFVAAYKARKGS